MCHHHLADSPQQQPRLAWNSRCVPPSPQTFGNSATATTQLDSQGRQSVGFQPFVLLMYLVLGSDCFNCVLCFHMVMWLSISDYFAFYFELINYLKVFYCCVFEMGFHYIDCAGLNPRIPLPLHPMYWDYQKAQAHPVCFVICSIGENFQDTL